MTRPVLALALAVSLASCGGTQEPQPTNTQNQPPGEQPAQDPGLQGTNTQQLEYPAGPFGINPGDTIKNIQLYGYRDPGQSGRKYEVINLADYYDPKGTKGYKTMMVNVSAVWCSVCRVEAPELVRLCDTNKAKGLVCYTSLFEDAEYLPAKRTDLDGWALDYSLRNNLVLDPQNKWGVFFDKAATPMNMFIDLKTMKIQEITVGFDSKAINASVEKYLQ